MNYFSDHWHGRLSVSRAGWLSSFVAIILVLPTYALELHSFLHLNGLSGIGDLMAHVQDGSIEGLTMPALWTQALDQCVEMAVLVWWSVGAWRSCDAHNRYATKPETFWFFKFMIILAAVIEVYEFYDFAKTALGFDVG